MHTSLTSPLAPRADGSRVVGLMPWLAALATPFVLTAVLLGNLHQALPTFHGSDESIYHLPVIKSFVQQLPLPDFSNYQSATTPLFHWLFAAFASLTGADLPSLRALNVSLSFAAVALLFAFLTRGRGWRRGDACLGAAAFGMSPYFFGASFLVLTDNLAWLFAIWSLWMLSQARSDAKALAPWLVCCAAAGLAVMTRQTHVWLVICLVGALLTSPTGTHRRLTVLAMLGVCLLPVATLVAIWGGLVPPAFQAGQGARIVHNPGLRINLKALVLVISLVGLYGVLLRPDLLRRFADQRTLIAAAVIAAAILFVVWTHPVTRIVGIDDGFVWAIAAKVMPVAGTSLLFWSLLPVGIAVIVASFFEDRTSLTTMGIGSALALAAVSTDFVFQKYFDPLVPLLLMVGRPLAMPLNRFDFAGYLLLLCGGWVYAIAQASKG